MNSKVILRNIKLYKLTGGNVPCDESHIYLYEKIIEYVKSFQEFANHNDIHIMYKSPPNTYGSSIVILDTINKYAQLNDPIYEKIRLLCEENSDEIGIAEDFIEVFRQLFTEKHINI